MGFSTCGQDGNVYFYELHGAEQNAPRLIRDHEFSKRDVKFSSVVNLNVLGKKNQFLAVGSEKVIFTETEDVKVLPRTLDVNTHQTPQLPVLKHHLS